MTQPFPFTYARAEVPTNYPAGNVIYFPVEQAVLPSYVPQLDFTTVTSVAIHVTRQPDASTATWITTTFTNVTTGGLVAVYTVLANDIGALPGSYFCRAYLTAGGISIPCQLTTLYVLSP